MGRYIGNITFIGDLKIILKTIGKVLKKEDIGERGIGKAIDFDKYRKKVGKK